MYTYTRETIDRSKGKVQDKLTPKENYMRSINGQDVEYLPNHTFFGMPYFGERTIAPFGTCTMLYVEDMVPGKQTYHDDWGVEYWYVPSANGGYLPSATHTGDYLIKDIYHWADYIHKPSVYDKVDWKAKAQKDLATFNRNETALVCGSPMMPFQQMMAMLGFNDGLEIIIEEPELFAEVENYMLDYLMPHIEANFEAYQPDLYYILDDTAAQRAPFISPKTFREVLLPVYKRLAEPAIKRGIPVCYHNCGKCEVFLEDMVKEIGVRTWDPAQPQNDIKHIQETLGKEYHLNCVGAFTWKEPDNWPNPDEEYVRQQMRDCIDTYAGGGCFMPQGNIIGPVGDALTAKVNNWLNDENYFYRREWMRKNG